MIEVQEDEEEAEGVEQTIDKNFGSFVLIKHGQSQLPACISSTEPLAVKFYDDHGKNEWTLQENSFVILDNDIFRQLEEPEWTLRGSRIYYKFKEYPF